MLHLKVKRRRWRIAATIVVVVIIGTAGYTPLLKTMGNFLIVEDDLQQVDLIHVLGGRFSRIDYAVELYHQGYAPHLFVTGDDDAIHYRQYAINRNVPVTAIFPEYSWAINTYQEAQELAQFLSIHPHIQSVLVVSSPYHMRRAAWTFQRVLGEQVQLYFVPTPTLLKPYRDGTWWIDPQTRRFALNEYLKYIYYSVKYAKLT